ncbi:SPOR domain-containing protein [Ramlibacter algicola]|uniref:SPOR domain-containing protein n=1 Tax=Ramlibacter algicola TaxID=2795217 RepID=A0A934PW32_9BURK|nr:SPOR domain-containing protein [Ramlibacter algicola]MBK0391550.1 SPOR domain-containing protein [Ramlibacter algicola]
MNRQRGNTLVGIVIGIVLGLAAALAVAVYVTKVPVPFLSKNQGRTPEQEAAEQKKNKDWDPNAPLYGRNPAKPLPPAPAVAGSAPAAGNAPPARPSASAPAPRSSADPLGEFAAAKAGTGAGAAEPFLYFVQTGAFRSTEDAEAQRAKLSLMGIEAKVTEREQSGRTVFRVRVGPFDRKDDADRAKDKLDAAGGIETALVRVQR